MECYIISWHLNTIHSTLKQLCNKQNIIKGKQQSELPTGANRQDLCSTASTLHILESCLKGYQKLRLLQITNVTNKRNVDEIRVKKLLKGLPSLKEFQTVAGTGWLSQISLMAPLENVNAPVSAIF